MKFEQLNSNIFGKKKKKKNIYIYIYIYIYIMKIIPTWPRVNLPRISLDGSSGSHWLISVYRICKL